MRIAALALIFGGVSFFAAAQPANLDGAKFNVTVTETGRPVPFSLPFAGAAPENPPMHAIGAGSDIPLAFGAGAVMGVLPANVAAGTHTFTVKLGEMVQSPVSVEKRANENALDVSVAGDKLTTFFYKGEDRKPYLWPLLAEGGASLTRDWPFSGKEGKTKDHPHHVSFWTAHGDLNGADFWEYGERTGWQVADQVTFGSGGGAGWIRAENIWQDKDRKPVIAEQRTYIFYKTPANGRLIDVNVKFTAAYGDVTFGDTKEGGIIGLRMNDDLRETGGTGKITTSEGAVGEKAAWGTPAAWCDYTGTLEGFGVRGITVMNHPSSFRYPIRWHVRAYGLLGANAFGYSDFTDGKENGEYTLKNGETMEFAFRIYLHSGDAQAADVAGYFKDYANPPVAKWAE